MRVDLIEPPTAAQIATIIRSALHQADDRAVAEVAARLAREEDCPRRLDALVFTDPTGDSKQDDDTESVDGDGADEDEDVESVLSDIKSHPGNVSLNSLLDEISKLKQVRAVSIPAKASPASASRSSTPGGPEPQPPPRATCAASPPRCGTSCSPRCCSSVSGRPAHRDAQRPRPGRHAGGDRRGEAPGTPAPDRVRLRHQLRDQLRRVRRARARAHRGRAALHGPPLSDRRRAEGRRRSDSECRLRGPLRSGLGPGHHHRGLGLHALQSLGPQHLHRVALPVRGRGVLVYWPSKRVRWPFTASF